MLAAVCCVTGQVTFVARDQSNAGVVSVEPSGRPMWFSGHHESSGTGEPTSAALAPGDALLLPEIGTMPPRKVVAERFLVSENGVIGWKDDGALRVLATEPIAMTVGELLDLAVGNATSPTPQSLPANTPLRLVRFGKTLAVGRLDVVGTQQAFVIDAAG